MKKPLSIAILILIIFTTFTTAQNLGEITAEFCNKNETNKELDIITKADQKTDVCINFYNHSHADATISIDFVDGTITPKGSKACFSPQKPNKNFGQFVLDYDHKLLLPGDSNIKQHYNIKFPAGFSGVSHGCLGYAIINQNKKHKGISLIFRKMHTIDILVGGTPINSNVNVKDIYISSNDILNQLVIDIVNNGNTNQTIQVSGTISNYFGYSQHIYTKSQVILANSTKTIPFNNIHIPYYRGLFKIKINISHQPRFNFDITNHNIPMEFTIPGNFSIKKTLILRNRFYIIGVIIVLSLIIKILFKYKR